MVRLWMHQPKHIKHDRYVSHGRAPPNARGINAHTWLPGAPDVRRQPQLTADSADGGVRVRQALSLAHTSSPGSAIGRLRLAAHIGSVREPRVRLNSAGIWPRAAVRQISVVFNIFRLVHPKALLGCVGCEGRQV